MGQAVNEITIYQRSGEVRTTLTSYASTCCIKSAEQKVELLGEDSVTIKVTSAAPLGCGIGDYIVLYGQRYTLNKAAEPTKKGERSYETSLKFEGLQYKLRDAQFRSADAGGHNPTATFSVVANLQLLGEMLINNINRTAAPLGELWELGECPVQTEYKDFSYSNENCLLVLQSACSEFETEFDIVEVGAKHYRLNLRKQGSILPLTYDYGKQSGLTKLTRKNINNNDIVTRLYIEGADKNISTSYRNGAGKLRISEDSYVEDAKAVALYGLKEGSKVYDDVYPHRTGRVTAVVEGEVLKFVDEEMFNLNEKDENGNTKWLISGTAAKVKFTGTSNLAGYEFEISSYNHKTNTFTLNYYEDKRGLKLPDGGSYSIKKGDEYVLIDICMPTDPYVTDAEEELRKLGEADLAELCQPMVEYELEVSSMAIERNYGNEGAIYNVFKVGDYLHVVDADINVDKHIRIKSFTRNAYGDLYNYKLTLSDTAEITIEQKLIEDIKHANEVIQMNNLTNVAKARANWRTTQELLNMIYDSDGYFDANNIRPQSIETMMLSVGNRAGQFVMTDVQIVCNPSIGGTPKPNILTYNSTGTAALTHYAIEEENRTWTMATTTSSITLSSTSAYYIYAQCPKNGSTFSITASQSKLNTDGGTYYYFLIGVLSSVYNGYRELTLTYGSTRITGRTINCGRIESVDKNTYFDLDNSEIGGNIKFRSTDGSLMGMDTLVANLTETFETITMTMDNLKEQVDGAVEYFYGKGAPSSTTYPESEWSTDGEKKEHINDIYTNTGTGLEYRYSYSPTNGFYWQEVASSGIGTAIQRANEAISTADGKSHTYVTSSFSVSLPATYKKGDLWIELTSFKMRYCITDSDGVSFNASHWKAAGYTDDTAANKALGKLQDLANDTLITPAEKLQLQSSMTNIKADFISTSCEATAVGADTSQLENAYKALCAYVEELLADMEATTEVNRQDYDSLFATYYEERATLMVAINQKYVDSIEIGQGNYIANSAFLSDTAGWEYSGGTMQLYTDSVMGSVFRLTKSSTTELQLLTTGMAGNGGNIMLPNDLWPKGRRYTIAFWARASKQISLRVGVMNGNGSKVVAAYKVFSITDSWQRISYTFTAANAAELKDAVKLFLRTEQATTYDYLLLTKFVLVEGSKAPEWTSCSEEYRAQVQANAETLKAIADNYTEIDGGLILSTYLKLGAVLASNIYTESAGVKAMLESKDEVAAYFGGTLAQAIAGKEGMTTIYHNGKLKADNAEITGKVTATDGEFRGSVIINNGTTMLNKDGSGQVANGKMSWKKNGDLSLTNLTLENATMNNITATNGSFEGVIKMSGGMIMGVENVSSRTHALGIGTSFALVHTGSMGTMQYACLKLPANPNTGQTVTLLNTGGSTLTIGANGKKIIPSHVLIDGYPIGRLKWERGDYYHLAGYVMLQLIFDGNTWWKINEVRNFGSE